MITSSIKQPQAVAFTTFAQQYLSVASVRWSLPFHSTERIASHTVYPGANLIALGKVTYSKGRTGLHPVRRESAWQYPSHLLNRPIQISLLTDWITSSIIHVKDIEVDFLLKHRRLDNSDNTDHCRLPVWSWDDFTFSPTCSESFSATCVFA